MTMRISKSEKKRQFKQTEKMAATLAEFTDNDIKVFPGSEQLKAEIKATRGLKGGARKRQIKYLAKVMRQDDLDSIYDFLEQKKGSQLKSNMQLHEAERLRDGLINEAMADHQYCMEEQLQWDIDYRSDIIEGLVEEYPLLKENEIRKGVYSYVKTRNKLHYRELFRMLRAAIEQDDRTRRMG